MRGKLGFFAGRKGLGQTWSLASSTPGGNYFGVAYGDGLFVAVGSDTLSNRIMTSPDGVTWTARTVPESQGDVRFSSVIYANGLWVAGGGELENSTNCVMTSPDGIAWTARTCQSTLGITGLAYGGSLFVAMSGFFGTANAIQTSPDGVTWTARTNPSQSGSLYTSVAYGDGLFVAVSPTATSPHIITSADGVTWTARDVVNGAEMFLNAVTYGNGLWVIAGTQTGSNNRVWTSIDGLTWTPRSPDGASGGTQWASAAFGDGVYVLVGTDLSDNAYISTSTDGITWTARTPPINVPIRRVAYGDGRFVATQFDNRGVGAGVHAIYSG